LQKVALKRWFSLRICDISKENRPRERLMQNSITVLSDAELLAIILQNGSYGENAIDMSNRLISSFGLSNLSSLSMHELMEIKGIGLQKASR